MDESFTPVPGRVCLITKDELRLIRLEGLKDVTIVFTYELPKKDRGSEVTPQFPTRLRALYAEYPSVKVVISTWLVESRHGTPFFLGLTRGMAAINNFRNDPATDAEL